MKLGLDIVKELEDDGGEKVMMRVSGPFYNDEDMPLRKALSDMGFIFNDKCEWSKWLECPCSVRAAWRLVAAVRMVGGYRFYPEDLALATQRIHDWVDRDLDIEAHALGPSGINFDPPRALHPESCANYLKRVLFVPFMRQKDEKNEPWEPALACVGRGAYGVRNTVLKPCGFRWDGETWYLNRSGLDEGKYKPSYETFADAAADIIGRRAGANFATDVFFVRLLEAARDADALEARARAAENNDALALPENDDIAEIAEHSAEEVEAEKLRVAQRDGNFFDMTASQETAEPSSTPPRGGAKARVKREPANDATAGVGGPQRTPPPMRSESRAPFARPRPRSRMSPPTPAPAATVVEKKVKP